MQWYVSRLVQNAIFVLYPLPFRHIGISSRVQQRLEHVQAACLYGSTDEYLAAAFLTCKRKGRIGQENCSQTLDIAMF